MKEVGLTRDGLYLIRPDGHVAMADAGKTPDALEQYMQVVFGRPATLAAPKTGD